MSNNMKGHTPGPWSMQPIGDETECNILGSQRELIATVADCDAPLIAQAPDLLAQRDELAEALRRVLEYIVPTDEFESSEYKAARAALAKVKP